METYPLTDWPLTILPAQLLIQFAMPREPVERYCAPSVQYDKTTVTMTGHQLEYNGELIKRLPPYGRLGRLVLARLIELGLTSRNHVHNPLPSLEVFARSIGVEEEDYKLLLHQLAPVLWTQTRVLREDEYSHFLTVYSICGELDVIGPNRDIVAGEALGTVRYDVSTFDVIRKSLVKVDLRVMRSLQTAFAIDLYSWLTHRGSKVMAVIEWEALACILNLDPVDLPDAVAEAYPEIQEFWPELHLELQPDVLCYRLV